MKNQDALGFKRFATALIAAVFVAVTAVAPVTVWADGEPPATEDDLKHIVTDTTWYNPNDGACKNLSGAGDILPNNIPPAWRDLLTKAAASKQASARLLAAIYLTENGNEWRPFDYAWSSSPAGAAGPFQFLPGTWDGHKADGNGDGVMDVMNVWDAAFAAADMIARIGARPDSPLGDLNKPLATPGSLVYVGIAYNAGPGFAEQTNASNPNITLDGITQATGKTEASEYAMNVYTLISSNFTKKGKPAYPDPYTAPGVEAGTTTTAGATSGSGPLIVIDPGHSGTAKSVTDPSTGLIDNDYPNHPEMEDVFDVSKLVETGLENSGYRVLLTKQNVNDYVSLRDRANVANTNGAALGISIHDQSGPVSGGSGGLPFSSDNNHVYIQKVGLYRTNQSGVKIEFTDQAVAQKSAQIGQTFASERTKAEGHTVDIATANIDRGPSFSSGNIWLTQLFSNVPWIYNEAGGNSDGQIGLNQTDKQKYADGIINSVKAAVPIGSNGCAAGTNAMVQKALELAWDTRGHSAPGYSGKFFGISKPEYQTGLAAARANLDTPNASGDWNAGRASYGDGDEAYSDCGVFVATVILSTGVDPNYPDRGTYNQLPYLNNKKTVPNTKWDLYTDITNTGDLRPGDVLIFNAPDDPHNSGHTYMYVGPQVGPDGKQNTGDEFNSVSASFHGHVPQAGNAYMDQGTHHFTVARLHQ